MSSRDPAEALEVDDLGEKDDRRQRVDAAEAAEPADGLAIGRGIRGGAADMIQ